MYKVSLIIVCFGVTKPEVEKSCNEERDAKRTNSANRYHNLVDVYNNGGLPEGMSHEIELKGAITKQLEGLFLFQLIWWYYIFLHIYI